jgi:hypothetical protein
MVMVAIAAAVQTRILEAAERHLGPSADEIVRDVCLTRLGTPFDKLEYHQLGALVRAVQADAGAVLRQRTEALAADIRQLQEDIEAGIPGRLVTSVARLLGPAAEPFMRNVCSRLGFVLETIDRPRLPEVAREAATEARPVFGEDTAEALKGAIERAASVRPAGMEASIVEAAGRHIGPKGEAFIRGLCRTRVEIDLDEIEPDGLGPLADAVAGDTSGVGAEESSAAFAQAVAAAIVSPNAALRAKILDTARKHIGPAAEDFMRRSCKKSGMPWDAIDLEHMMWLAEVVRAESAPLIGKKSADDFARTVRAFLTKI